MLEKAWHEFLLDNSLLMSDLMGETWNNHLSAVLIPEGYFVLGVFSTALVEATRRVNSNTLPSRGHS